MGGFGIGVMVKMDRLFLDESLDGVDQVIQNRGDDPFLVVLIIF